MRFGNPEGLEAREPRGLEVRRPGVALRAAASGRMDEPAAGGNGHGGGNVAAMIEMTIAYHLPQ